MSRTGTGTVNVGSAIKIYKGLHHNYLVRHILFSLEESSIENSNDTDIRKMQMHLTLTRRAFQNHLKGRGGGQMAHRWKSAILAIFLHSKHQESYQGTLGTQELPQTGSMTSHGPSLGLTGSFKRTLWFLRFCKAVFTFFKKYIL